ncbi:hypothetical protein B0H21DRAFT_881538 [Amylocystis lapponica]|nr:hypothetical protein B0H21DRAFT_881538 [Amylocystis lapponica]
MVKDPKKPLRVRRLAWLQRRSANFDGETAGGAAAKHHMITWIHFWGPSETSGCNIPPVRREDQVLYDRYQTNTMGVPGGRRRGGGARVIDLISGVLADSGQGNMAITADKGAFVGFCVEAVFYGLYILIFFMSVGVLTVYRKQDNVSWSMLFMTCLLFTCCTVHFGLEFDNKLDVLFRRPGIISFEVETTELLACDILASITDFFSQLVMIYRCWLVWSKKFWVVVIPLLIAMGSIGCSMAGLGLLALVDPTAPLAPPEIAPLGTASFALSLCLNVIVTFLIIGRIYWVARGVARKSGTGNINGFFRTLGSHDYIRAVTAMLIESGSLFLAAQLSFVVLFALGNPAQDVVYPAAVQIYGIAPTLIIVRVGLGFVAPHETLINKSSSHQRISTRPAISIRTETTHIQDVELASFDESTKHG